MIQRKCETCKKIFLVWPYQPKVGEGKYCSKQCYFSNKERNKKLSESRKGINNPMYGKQPWNKGKPWPDNVKQKISHANIGHIAWNKGKRGKKFIDSKGRIMVYFPEHPHCHKKGLIPEHRLVTEKIIHRYLKPQEVVHHIDKNRQNNSPENLMLFPNNHEHLEYHHKFSIKSQYLPK